MKNNKITFCTFFISNKMFGIDILDIKEIHTETYFTEIDHTPNFFKGYVNIRGNLYLIGDVSNLLGLKSSRENINHKLLIFKNHIDEAFGIIVDNVGDTIEVEEDEIFDRRSNDEINFENDNKECRRSKTNISNGVIKLENELLITINAYKVLENMKNV